MNIISQPEFKLIYYNVVVQHICHYATGTTHNPLDLWDNFFVLFYFHILVFVFVLFQTLINPHYIYIYIYIYSDQKKQNPYIFVEVKWILFFWGHPVYICFIPNIVHGPSHLRVQNTPTASLQRGKTSPTSLLDMTWNNLMVRFQ